MQERIAGQTAILILLAGISMTLSILPLVQKILLVLKIKQAGHRDFLIIFRIVLYLSGRHIHIDLIRVELCALRLVQLIVEVGKDFLYAPLTARPPVHSS